MPVVPGEVTTGLLSLFLSLTDYGSCFKFHFRSGSRALNIEVFFIAQRGRVFINGEPIIYSLYQQRSSIPTTAFGCYSGIMLCADDRIIV